VQEGDEDDDEDDDEYDDEDYDEDDDLEDDEEHELHGSGDDEDDDGENVFDEPSKRKTKRRNTSTHASHSTKKRRGSRRTVRDEEGESEDEVGEDGGGGGKKAQKRSIEEENDSESESGHSGGKKSNAKKADFDSWPLDDVDAMDSMQLFDYLCMCTNTEYEWTHAMRLAANHVWKAVYGRTAGPFPKTSQETAAARTIFVQRGTSTLVQARKALKEYHASKTRPTPKKNHRISGKRGGLQGDNRNGDAPPDFEDALDLRDSNFIARLSHTFCENDTRSIYALIYGGAIARVDLKIQEENQLHQWWTQIIDKFCDEKWQCTDVVLSEETINVDPARGVPTSRPSVRSYKAAVHALRNRILLFAARSLRSDSMNRSAVIAANLRFFARLSSSRLAA
jgi:hypothetical protein